MAETGALTVTIRATGFTRMARVLANVWACSHRAQGHTIKAEYRSGGATCLRCSCGSSFDLFNIGGTSD